MRRLCAVVCLVVATGCAPGPTPDPGSAPDGPPDEPAGIELVDRAGAVADRLEERNAGLEDLAP